MDELINLSRKLRWSDQRREAERKQARFDDRGRLKPRIIGNASIRESALERKPIDDGRAEIWITYTGMREAWLQLRSNSAVVKQLPELLKTADPQALNGYVAFPKRRTPKLPPEAKELTKYIPVHGGITYACKDSLAAVWGFDTMHYGSENQPRTERAWIRANCWILYRGLLLAEQLWPEFRRASETRRVELAQQLLDLVPEQPLGEKLSTEAMISVLSLGKV